MSKQYELSNKKPKVGNNVSHSKRRTKMRQEPNLQWKSFYLAEEDCWVRLRVTTRMIRTIYKKGLAAVLREANAKN